MVACSVGPRLNEVIAVWRNNRCISQGVITRYRQWPQQFITYCTRRKLKWEVELTLAGTMQFVKWYVRSRGIRCALSQPRSALHAWREALQTLGQPFPPWKPSRDLSSGLSPVLREFAAHIREHRGNPENTIHDRVVRVATFLAFLRKRRRSLRDLRLSDLDAYVVKCAKHYAPATVADVCTMLRSFTRFLRATGSYQSILRPRH
jgi:integrase/recombinase XerD